MFIGRAINPGPALQRSAMFPAMVRETSLRFAPLERGGVFWGCAFYKHFVPTGRGTIVGNLVRKQDVVGLLRRLPKFEPCSFIICVICGQHLPGSAFCIIE